MGLRAQRKKMAKKFRVGDIVTWGNGSVNAKVDEVSSAGLYVNTVMSDGRPAPRYFVPFVPDTDMEPLRLVERPKGKG